MSAIAIGSVVLPYAPPRIWTVLAVGAMLPDLDALGRPFGHGDIALFGGHRALTHSISAAAVLSLIATWHLRRERTEPEGEFALWAAMFIAFASHGVLDAFTAYGSGVAFLAPWNWTRFHAPWALFTGFAADTALFVLAAVVARVVIVRRGWPLPRLLSWGQREHET